MKKPTTATTVGTVYLISNQAGLHKIGITGDWNRRQRELEVGIKTTAVLTATVIRPKALELALHRRFQAQRLPQSEWFSLAPEQLQEAISTIEVESQKLTGDSADLHLKLDAAIHEAGQCRKAGDDAGWSRKLREVEQLRRQIDPDYDARAVAREQAAEHARRLRRKNEAEYWNRTGWWRNALITGAVLPAVAALPVIGILSLPWNAYATAKCGLGNPECGNAIVRPVIWNMASIAGVAILASTVIRLRQNAKDKREVGES